MTKDDSYISSYLQTVALTVRGLDTDEIARAVNVIRSVRDASGRLFCMGVGGSASTASHAASDFRALCGIDTVCPTDSPAFITAAVNDFGWDTAYQQFLRASGPTERDAALFFSVGGGQLDPPVSVSLVRAANHLGRVGCRLIAVVGRDGGALLQLSEVGILIPTLDAENVTYHAENTAIVVHHLLASHPDVRVRQTKWQQLDGVQP